MHWGRPDRRRSCPTRTKSIHHNAESKYIHQQCRQHLNSRHLQRAACWCLVVAELRHVHPVVVLYALALLVLCVPSVRAMLIVESEGVIVESEGAAWMDHGMDWIGAARLDHRWQRVFPVPIPPILPAER